MAASRTRHTKAFRPTLGTEGGALEARWLMAGGRAGTLPPPIVRQHLVLPQTGSPLTHNGLPTSATNYVQTGVANGGKAAVMIDTDGEIFVAHLTGGGTVRARAVPGGYVDLSLYGTTPQSILTIDPQGAPITKKDAHLLATGTVLQDGMIHIRNITVYNGQINQILGYRDATLSGNLLVPPNSLGSVLSIDRIAFYSLLPGASIEVPGDLQTLDIFNTAYLNGGVGVSVGRDLNSMSVGGDLTLANGAAVIAGRDIGLVAQVAKGSGPGGQGVFVGGNLVVGPGGTIAPVRYMVGTLGVRGSATGLQFLPLQVLERTVVLGTTA
jgi:hypothetical protein